MPEQPDIPRGRGFRLADLVVVLAFITVLMGMLLAAIRKANVSAQQADCANNLKQFGISVANYAGDHQDKLPPILDYYPKGNLAHWWPFWFGLRPYLGTGALSTRVRGANGWDNGNHAIVFKDLLCPLDTSHDEGISPASGWAVTSYAPLYQLYGTVNDFDPEKKAHVCRAKYTIGNIPDGTSQQVSVVERFGHFPSHGWSNAAYYPCDETYFGWNQWGSVYGVWGLNFPQIRVSPADANPYYPNSAHPFAHVLLLDGSVRAISSDVTSKLWMLACVPDDGPPWSEW